MGAHPQNSALAAGRRPSGQIGAIVLAALTQPLQPVTVTGSRRDEPDTVVDHLNGISSQLHLAARGVGMAHDVGDALTHHPGEELAQLGVNGIHGQRQVGADSGRGQDVRGPSQLAGQAQARGSC